MHTWIIGCACLCESSPLNFQSCILDPIRRHEQPTWPNTFLPPRSRTWLIFVFLTVGRRVIVQSDYLTMAALRSPVSHSLTTLPSGGRVAEETCVKALHDGQIWLLFSPLTPCLYLHLSQPSHSFPSSLPDRPRRRTPECSAIGPFAQHKQEVSTAFHRQAWRRN